MIFLLTISVLLLFVVAHFFWRAHRQRVARRRAMAAAVAAGLAIDDDGLINAGLTHAAMLAHEGISGLRFSGQQAELLETIRMVIEGPTSLDEIRVLLDRGIQPIVRPDGRVYVPSPENEHLSMPGEVPLELEDLTVLDE
jgi:hypothetical protein